MSFHSAVTTASNVLSTSGLSATVGDRLFAVVSSDDEAAFTSSGWTALATIIVTGDGQTGTVLELNGGITSGWIASPPANYTFSNGANSDAAGILWTQSNRGSGTSHQETQDNTLVASPRTMVLTGVTASAGDDLVIVSFLDSFSGSATFAAATWTGTGSFTARGTVNQGGVTSIGISSLDNVAAGATGNISVVETNGGTTAWGGFVLAFRAVSGSSGTGSAALSPFAGSGVGSESYTATVSAALSSFAATAVGAIKISGSGGAALSPFAGSGSGANGSGSSGSGSAALSPFAPSGVGLVSGASGSGSAAVSPFADSGAGLVGNVTSTGIVAVSPFAPSGVGLLSSVTGSGSAAVSPFAGSGSSNLPAARVGFTALASHGSGVLTNPWSNSEPRIIKDVGGSGELFGFGWSDKLYLFKSADNGDTWSFVDPTAGEAIGTTRICCAAQDSTGKVHITYIDGPGGRFQYARIALSYTSGAITGFASVVKDITLPGTYNTNVDIRCTLRAVFDALGTETLVHCTTTDIPAGTFTVVMGKAPINPAVSADWVALDGTSGSTVVFQTNAWNDHDHSSCWAQLGTKDIWVFWGPTEAEFGGLDGTSTTRVKLTASGHTWSVGTPIVMVGQDSITIPMALCCFGTANFVWFMYVDPTDGLCFDRVNAAGTYTHSAIPSPDNGPDRNGWGVFTVAPDETRIWACWNTIGDAGPGTADRTKEGFWNGSTWTTFAETTPFLGDSWGFGGTLNWTEGLVTARLDPVTFAISLSTIRGGAIASPISGAGSAALGTFTSSGVGLVTCSGSGSSAVSRFACAGTGTESCSGSGSATLSAFACTGIGADAYTGSGSVSISPFASVGVGSGAYTGSGSSSISPFASVGIGAVDALLGVGTATFSTFAVLGLGVAGATLGVGAATLQAFAVVGVGSESYTSVAAALWTAFQPAGVGIASSPIFGSGSATLQAFAALGVGSVPLVSVSALVTITQYTDCIVTITQRKT